jgi:hypothetical protein
MNTFAATFVGELGQGGAAAMAVFRQADEFRRTRPRVRLSFSRKRGPRMEKRYQVFVSSTYEDLKAERQEVMHALLELDCIPSGMELFPAANEDQWTLIQQVINDCDYYIVIVGGKYGSTDESGRSYTEREYRYAVERNKPVIGFLHQDPLKLLAGQTEQDATKRKSLEDFQNLVKGKVCKFWTSPADLGSVVSRSLISLIKRHPAVGWVRGDLVPDESASQEILRLRKEIDGLQLKLANSYASPPAGATNLAQGEEEFTIKFQFESISGIAASSWGGSQTYDLEYPASWNDIFAMTSPILIHEATDETFRKALESMTGVLEEISKALEEEQSSIGMRRRLNRVTIDPASYQTIVIQFRALGLIAKSAKPRSIKDSQTYWTLTPYGDALMTRLRAIPHMEDKSGDPRSP